MSDISGYGTHFAVAEETDASADVHFVANARVPDYRMTIARVLG